MQITLWSCADVRQQLRWVSEAEHEFDAWGTDALDQIGWIVLCVHKTKTILFLSVVSTMPGPPVWKVWRLDFVQNRQWEAQFPWAHQKGWNRRRRAKHGKVLIILPSEKAWTRVWNARWKWNWRKNGRKVRHYNSFRYHLMIPSAAGIKACRWKKARKTVDIRKYRC